MKKTNAGARGFTLIELLVVIAIIGLLAAIVIPSIQGAMRSAKRARALSQMTSLDAAIKRFFMEYGRMPMPKGVQYTSTIRDMGCTPGEASEIVQILINYDDWNDLKQNTRNIVFLDLDPASFTSPIDGKPCKTEAEMKTALLNDGYKDPWGNPYGILLDLTLDDKIEAPPYGTAANPVRAKVGGESWGESGDTTVQDPPYKTW